MDREELLSKLPAWFREKYKVELEKYPDIDKEGVQRYWISLEDVVKLLE